jgi:hypothetical protein
MAVHLRGDVVTFAVINPKKSLTGAPPLTFPRIPRRKSFLVLMPNLFAHDL